MTATHTFDPDHAWRVADGVAVRPEAFGALAYDFRTRRLSFLKDQTLAEVVRELGRQPSAGAAVEAADIEPERRPAFLDALTSLAASGMIEPAQPQGSSSGAQA